MHYFTSARARVERGVGPSPTLFLRAHRIFQVSGGGSVPGLIRLSFPVFKVFPEAKAPARCPPVIRQCHRCVQQSKVAAFSVKIRSKSLAEDGAASAAFLLTWVLSAEAASVQAETADLGDVEKATQIYFFVFFPLTTKILLAQLTFFPRNRDCGLFQAFTITPLIGLCLLSQTCKLMNTTSLYLLLQHSEI